MIGWLAQPDFGWYRQSEAPVAVPEIIPAGQSMGMAAIPWIAPQQPSPAGVADLTATAPAFVYAPATPPVTTTFVPVQVADTRTPPSDPPVAYARPAVAIPFVRLEIAAPATAPTSPDGLVTPVFQGPRGLTPITAPVVVIERPPVDPGCFTVSLRGPRGLTPIAAPVVVVERPPVDPGSFSVSLRGPRGLTPIMAPVVVVERPPVEPGSFAISLRGTRGLTPITAPVDVVERPPVDPGAFSVSLRGPRGLTPIAAPVVVIERPPVDPGSFTVSLRGPRGLTPITAPVDVVEGPPVDPGSFSVSLRGPRGLTPIAAPVVVVERPPVDPGSFTISLRGPRGLTPITAPVDVVERPPVDPGAFSVSLRGPRGLTPIAAPVVVIERPPVDPGSFTVSLRGTRGLTPIAQLAVPIESVPFLPTDGARARPDAVPIPFTAVPVPGSLPELVIGAVARALVDEPWFGPQSSPGPVESEAIVVSDPARARAPDVVRPLIQVADVVEAIVEAVVTTPVLGFSPVPEWIVSVDPTLVDDAPEVAGDFAWVPLLRTATPVVLTQHADLFEVPWIWPHAPIIIRLRPPVPPRPRPRQVGRAGGGGGGGWSYCDPLDPMSECDIEPDEVNIVEEDLGATPELAVARSVPEKIAELLGPGFAGFTVGKSVTRIAGEKFGKPGATIAAIASVFAAKSAASGLKRKYKWPLVIGSALAAFDDLVDIYVDERPVGLEEIRDPVEFLKAARVARAPINVTRTSGVIKATGEEVAVLRYRIPGKQYQEILRRGADGRFDATKSLLRALRSWP